MVVAYQNPGFKAFLKTRMYPVFLVARAVYGFLGYYRRVYRLGKKLASYDGALPFGGAMGEGGWAEFRLGESSVATLRGLYDGAVSLRLDARYAAPVSEIFDIIGEPLAAYFGGDVQLDGIYWMVTTAENAKLNISSNWHTDNVGNRIKVFVCVEGDGSQPTAVIPRGHRHRLSLLSKEVLYEAVRWARIPFKVGLTGEMHLRHRTGTIFAFDTHNFHRGVYEKAASDRKIFLLEFSQKRKAEDIEGPIGTKPYNSFAFTEEYLRIEGFRRFLDMSRVHYSETDRLYRYLPPGQPAA